MFKKSLENIWIPTPEKIKEKQLDTLLQHISNQLNNSTYLSPEKQREIDMLLQQVINHLKLTQKPKHEPSNNFYLIGLNALIILLIVLLFVFVYIHKSKQ